MAAKKTQKGKKLKKSKGSTGVFSSDRARSIITALFAGGSFYLYDTKDGNKTRKSLEKTIRSLRNDVAERVRKTSVKSERAYHRIVDEATKYYKQAKSIDQKELRQAAKEIKGHWKHIKARMKSGGRKK